MVQLYLGLQKIPDALILPIKYSVTCFLGKRALLKKYAGRVAVYGAWLNVRINAGDIEDKAWVEAKLSAAQSIAAKADALEQEVIGLVERHVG
jgi:hypothetical protein